MTRSPLAPVFAALRWGLHALVVGLVVLAAARALGGPRPGGVLAAALAFLAVYAWGGYLARPHPRRAPWAAPAWFALLALAWVALTLAQPDGVYLVFPLFFLALHLLRGWGPAAVAALTAVAVTVIGVRSGWTVGGVVGPLVAAAVAVFIGLGYRALAAESAERERLLGELLATRDALVSAEREQAVLAERARLARDIHDTVAQGLSSIGMLLHAAERADPDRPGVEHVRLARETAAASLAETRGLIRELAPPDLRGNGLAGALERLAATQWRPAGLDVRLQAADLDLPMDLATPLLRIAQGAMANVVQHSGAERATIRVGREAGCVVLVVADDGRGFDPGAVIEPSSRGRDSFGLRAIRERVEALGGTLDVRSAPGEGCEIRVEIEDRGVR